MYRKFQIFVVLTGLFFAVGCNQISSSDESIRDNRAATVTANVSATLSSTTLNPTLISEGLEVQAAMDLWMAETDDWPEALEVPTRDLSTTYPALAPTHLKIAELRCEYTWDSQGRTEQHC